EVADDARQHLIAFLPVAARHVKREARAIAPRSSAVEGDVRALGREAAALERDLVGAEAKGALGGERQMTGERLRGERSPLARHASRGAERRAHRLHARRRRNRQLSAAAVLGKTSERPLEQNLPRCGAGEAKTPEILEVGEG